MNRHFSSRNSESDYQSRPKENSHRDTSPKKKIEDEHESRCKDWSVRNGKSGRMDYALREDEEIFREHMGQMEKKQTFDFSNLKNVDLKITFQGKDLSDMYEYNRFEEIPYIEDKLKANLKKMGFSLMTPIQKAVMPYLFQGHDVMGCSQTGSGKTVAFLLPIINKMLKDGYPEAKGNDYGAKPVALILVPTRELAEQIYKEARKLVHKTGMSVVKVFGGVSNMSQARELRSGCDILVATPGRLLDFLRSRELGLSQVKFFIQDEADRMLDMGFEPQLKSVVFEFDLCDKLQRTNLMFSATFEPEIKNIARKFMNEFYFVHTNTEMRASQNVKQVVVFAKESEKVLQLHKILQTVQGSIIIFLDTKRGVENLNAFLDRSNYNCISIHGDKKQWQRQEAIKKFSAGDIPILIATDVASRGLDFPKVSYVFNFDMPSNIDDYVHRIGRTGRGGDFGTAISFVNENNRNIIKPLHRILKDLNQEIPEFMEKMFTECGNYAYSNPRDRRGNSDFLNRKRNDNFGKDSGYQRKESAWNQNGNNNNNSSYQTSGNSYNRQAWDNKPSSNSYGSNGTPGFDKPSNNSYAPSRTGDKPTAYAPTSSTGGGWDKPEYSSYAPSSNNSGWDKPNNTSSSQPMPTHQYSAPVVTYPLNSNNRPSNFSNPVVNSVPIPTHIQPELPKFNYGNDVPVSHTSSSNQISWNSSVPVSKDSNIDREKRSSHHSSRDHRSSDRHHSSHRDRDQDKDRSRDYDRDRSRDHDKDRRGDQDRDRRREDDKRKSWRNDDEYYSTDSRNNKKRRSDDEERR